MTPEHEHVWIGYCDLCNGQHCITLKAADAKVERRLHGDPVCVAALRERDAAWREAVTALLPWAEDWLADMRIEKRESEREGFASSEMDESERAAAQAIRDARALLEEAGK